MEHGGRERLSKAREDRLLDCRRWQRETRQRPGSDGERSVAGEDRSVQDRSCGAAWAEEDAAASLGSIG
ncbi:hypothetical protein M0R45_005045 [Rubus argutus]|uniref:Uncharacterized protein n=1 Tax=Rubus argutus TaxID=59490 RepID=A0AAW1YLH1_RUBAR